MADLLASSDYSFKSYKRGDVVEGTITSIMGKQVLIDIGGKMEGVVGDKEWDDVKGFVATLKPGDKVTANVITAENEQGHMILSIRRFVSGDKWAKANKLLTSGEQLTVRVLEGNKGGFMVDVPGLMKGFLPTSQLSSSSDTSKLTGKTIDVKVIEVDQKQNRLVVSEKAVTAVADKKARLEAISTAKIKAGQKYSGKVSGIVGFGLFVTLDDSGVEGLVHASEVSWEKMSDLNNLFKVGDKIEVQILGTNEEDGKLNLSIKRLTDDPWLEVSKKFEVEKEVKGTVLQTTSAGVYVTLAKGIDGLIATDKVPAGKQYEAGEKISVVINDINEKSRRISLSPVLTKKFVGYR